MHLDLAFARADVERSAGRTDGARQALERAVEVAEAKGNRVAAERARRRSEEASSRGTHVSTGLPSALAGPRTIPL